MAQEIKPQNITIDRNTGLLRIIWRDGHQSDYPLRWVRANCPCATCREERRAAELNTDPLRLHSGPLPSVEIAGAELVGNYALRPIWGDGHDSGIYPFTLLRVSCPCAECHPAGAPTLLAEAGE